MSCELSNWTGKAYKIPRTQVPESIDREDLSNTGVYLLLGKNEDEQNQVYIGEAENVLIRLKQHLIQKEFWHECIVFISKDENLNKAHVKYLEHKLYVQAEKAKRYQLDNNNIPTQPSISEADRAEMEEFLGNIILLVNTLGHKVFEEKRASSAISKKRNPILYLKQAQETLASGQRSNEGFVVFKDSFVIQKLGTSFPISLQRKREQLLKENILLDENGKLRLTQDLIFASPSTAAMFIFGRSSNGLDAWVNEKGISLKILDQQVSET
jgi:hypothetical protein